MIDDPRIELTDLPPQEARDVILAGLIEFNRRALGNPQGRPLALLLYATDGAVIGGMWARTGFQWLSVELLFVPEPLRGRGLGRGLLDRAEQEAKRRGCIGAWLETFSPQARSLYERCATPSLARLPTIRRAMSGASSASDGIADCSSFKTWSNALPRA